MAMCSKTRTTWKDRMSSSLFVVAVRRAAVVATVARAGRRVVVTASEQCRTPRHRGPQARSAGRGEHRSPIESRCVRRHLRSPVPSDSPSPAAGRGHQRNHSGFTAGTDDIPRIAGPASVDIAYPAGTATVAYYACVVLFSWSATFGTLG